MLVTSIYLKLAKEPRNLRRRFEARSESAVHRVGIDFLADQTQLFSVVGALHFHFPLLVANATEHSANRAMLFWILARTRRSFSISLPSAPVMLTG